MLKLKVIMVLVGINGGITTIDGWSSMATCTAALANLTFFHGFNALAVVSKCIEIN